MKRMHTFLSISLTLAFFAGLIACGEEGREAVHGAVDDVYEQVELHQDDLQKLIDESAEDLSRLKSALDERASELSAAAALEYRERLAELEVERRALDERLAPAKAAGAEAWTQWQADAAEFKRRCAAAWEAFRASEEE